MAGINKKFLLNFQKNRHVKKRADDAQLLDHGWRLSGTKPASHLLSPGSAGASMGLGHSSSTGDLYIASAGTTSPTFDDLTSPDADINTELLMQQVQRCDVALSALKQLISRDTETGTSTASKWEEARTHLSEVVSSVTDLINNYPSIESADIMAGIAGVITRVKDCSVDNSAENVLAVSTAVDSLSNQLTKKCMQLAEHVMSDMLNGSCQTTASLPKAKSMECLVVDRSTVNGHHHADDLPMALVETETDIGSLLDNILHGLESGVEMALHRAQAWSKFAKDLITYFEKRTNLWNEFTRNLSKLAKSLQQTIGEDSYLPFHSVLSTAICQDEGMTNLFTDARNAVTTTVVTAPLNSRRLEHDQIRKNLKTTWAKQLSKMHDAVSNMRKAKSMYVSRHQDYDKAKEMTLKADAELAKEGAGGNTALATKVAKLKKQEDEALCKAIESEAAYKASIVAAGIAQKQLEETKTAILRDVRELINESDRILKLVTVGYFDLMKESTLTIPLQFRALCEASQHYVPGSHYANYIRHLRPADNAAAVTETFTFEPFMSRYREVSAGSYSISPDIMVCRDKGSLHGMQGGDVDSDDVSVGSSMSLESSPTASPYQSHHQTLVTSASVNELNTVAADDDTAKYGISGGDGMQTFHGTRLSYAALTHQFRRVHTHCRCGECDQFVYFQGAECEVCGVVVHKKCLEIMRCTCDRQQTQHFPQTHGIEAANMAGRNDEVPYLVKKCIAEIDMRGLDIKGIYRLSGVKSRVDQLCQSFETDERAVVLSDHHPNVIANVLKLYFRQLPEPLLTFSLYPDFIRLARDELQGGSQTTTTLLASLTQLLDQLPKQNRKTLDALVRHLNRVANHQDVNQMSASNLGIVFGPTLLRPREGASSLNYLIETPFQTRIVELLIDNVHTVFSADDVTDFVLTSESSCLSQIHRAENVHLRAEQAGFSVIDAASPGIGSWYAPELTKDLLQELEPHLQQVLQDTNTAPPMPSASSCTDDVMKMYNVQPEESNDHDASMRRLQ